MDVENKYRVSLVVPCFQGETWIAKCMESIAAQTLDRNDFEVIIVINGPIDGSPDVVQKILGRAPEVNFTIIYSRIASLSNARNIGIANARGSTVTWVDVDDWLSPNFLQELVEVAADGIVPVARVVDVDEVTGEIGASPISEQILSHAPGVVDPAVVWRPLGFAACKLLPTELARQKLFDVDLRSGEDIAYFAPFVAEYGLKFDTRPAHAGATYYRLVRSSSMSRQEPNFDFSVNQRLAVMAHLDEATREAPEPLADVMRSMMNSQTLFMSRYLDSRPDEYRSVRDKLYAAGLEHTPWKNLTSRTGNLAISFNFPPFADASALVAAKRLYDSNEHWNVISNDMTGVRTIDPSLAEITNPVVSRQRTLRASTRFGSWRSVEEFCEQGEGAIRDLEGLSGPQRKLYSRSMWPASHFLAALHKLEASYPVEWTAEFSDPLSRDAAGRARPSDEVGEGLRQRLGDALRGRGLEPPESRSLFVWAETLPYLLADRLLFTNVHQLNYMLSYVANAGTAMEVRRKARISPQPVPARRLYELRQPAYRLDRSRVNIGYFGTFYPNRGAGAVIEALGRTPPEVRSSLKMHIFAPSDADMLRRIQTSDLSDSITWTEQVGYLEFLSLSTRFDLLLVADADTMADGRRLNPYRPSKLSDYRGAHVPIWSLYEPGSVLSREDVRYRTRLGDLEGIEAVLRLISTEKRT